MYGREPQYRNLNIANTFFQSLVPSLYLSNVAFCRSKGSKLQNKTIPVYSLGGVTRIEDFAMYIELR